MELEIPDWTPEQWTAAATVGTFAVAFVALVVAIVQTEIARRVRKDEARPAVHVELQLNPRTFQGIDLVVRNLGRTVARDVTLAFDPPLTSSLKSGRPINELAFIRDGVPSLAPGGEVRTLFDRLPQRREAALPESYRVTVSCRDTRGRRQPKLEYVLDLGLFYGLRGVGPPPVPDVATSLHSINDRLRGWTVRGRLGVWARDEDAQRRAEMEQMDLDALEELNAGRHPRQAEIEALMAGEAPPSRRLRGVVRSVFAWLRRRR